MLKQIYGLNLLLALVENNMHKPFNHPALGGDVIDPRTGKPQKEPKKKKK